MSRTSRFASIVFLPGVPRVVPISLLAPQHRPTIVLAAALCSLLVTLAPTAKAGEDTVQRAFDVLCPDQSVVSAIVLKKTPGTPGTETALEMVRDSGVCRPVPLEKSYAPVGQTGHNTLESTGIIRVSGNQPDFTKSLAQTQFVQANCNTMGCTNNTFPVFFKSPTKPAVMHCFPCDPR